MTCPACHADDTQVLRQHAATAAAEHFVPRQRDQARHAQLVAYLRELWGADEVTVRECRRCGFGFADPFVDGGARFYELVHEGDPHYPAKRWEFGQTLEAMGTRPAALLEVGAGDGAFLDALVSAFPEGGRAGLTAAEYDEGAIQRLKEKGYDAWLGSVGDVDPSRRFDAICMFQALEHMADVDTVLGRLRTLLGPGGSLYLSVPNGDAIRGQEELTGLWDMPPNHVGRWTPMGLREAARRNSLDVTALALEPVPLRAMVQQLAVSAVNARAYEPGSLEARVNGLRSRGARGVLKRVVALRYVPGLLANRRRIEPYTMWARLQAGQ